MLESLKRLSSTEFATHTSGEDAGYSTSFTGTVDSTFFVKKDNFFFISNKFNTKKYFHSFYKLCTIFSSFLKRNCSQINSLYLC